MSVHSRLGPGDAHVIHSWVYADEAARLAATGFVASDVLHLAYQASDATYWVLKSISPPAWGAVGSGASPGPGPVSIPQYTSATLPAPGADNTGTLARLKDPGVDEQLLMCLQKADATYAWTNDPSRLYVEASTALEEAAAWAKTYPPRFVVRTDLPVTPPPPSVTSFVIGGTVDNVATISVFSGATTAPATITGYMVTVSPVPPGAADAGWLVAAPTTWVGVALGTITLYPWVKDSNGNVSAAHAPASVTFTTVSDRFTGSLNAALWQVNLTGGTATQGAPGLTLDDTLAAQTCSYVCRTSATRTTTRTYTIEVAAGYSAAVGLDMMDLRQSAAIPGTQAAATGEIAYFFLNGVTIQGGYYNTSNVFTTAANWAIAGYAGAIRLICEVDSANGIRWTIQRIDTSANLVQSAWVAWTLIKNWGTDPLWFIIGDNRTDEQFGHMVVTKASFT